MNLSIRNLPFLCLFGLVVISACKKQDYTSVEALDDENIAAYIQANNLNMEPLGTTGMFYQIIEEGKGSDLTYTKSYPIVYTKKSLDGTYSVADTFASASRYMDFLGYFLGETNQGSVIANIPAYQQILEKDNGLKMALRTVLKKSDGKIRILVPSRLFTDSRNGNADLGIPPNASMDYEIRVLDSASVPAYDDVSIKTYMQKNSLTDFQRTEDGVYYKITEQGEGSAITVDSVLNVNLTVRLLNGTETKSPDSTDFPVAYWNRVNAWKTVLPNLKKGGTVTIISPSAQAYGFSSSSEGFGGSSAVVIPPFSSVYYELKLNDKK